jgi:two-component system sensor kinase FixL
MSATPVPSRRLKWHHIYYLLAAFDLATVSFSLYLNHQILGIYTESVIVNQEWADRAASYTELARLTAAVNAPGNDVFDTQEVARESANLDRALARFERSLDAARADVEANVPKVAAAAMASGLDRTHVAMGQMVAESRRIFDLLAQGDPEAAGRRMAEMDRKYFEVRSALDDLQREVRDIQKGKFRTQTAAAANLAKYEYVVGSFIVLMVIAITLYGHKLARKMASDQEERERVLAESREAEARTRAIFDTAADGVITADHRGVIESMNAAASEIFGYEPEELIGRNVSMLMPEPDRAAHDGYIARYLHTGAARILGVGGREVVGQRKDGSTFPVEIAVSEVRLGGRPLFTAILQDITARKRAETLVRKYNEELEATVQERTEGLRQALEKQSELAEQTARAYDAMRRTQQELVRQERLAAIGELAAAIAHGLQNPLASIRALAEVAAGDLPDDGPVAETLADIVAEVGRLGKRIRTVLDFARPFEPTLARGDLNAFLGDYARAIRRRVPETVRLDIDLDPGIPELEFDAGQTREVLEALVTNALEAMGPAGCLTIRSRLEVDPAGERWATLRIIDSGPGIDPGRQGRIFDLFYTTKPSGTGIGLATARRLVECQGGTIAVTSTPGAGSTFAVAFPVERPGARRAA